MAGGKKTSTVDTARRIIQPVLDQMGLELWDTRFEKEGSSWFLRYFIDKEGGVTIQDCENVSRAVERLLDEADPISQSYILEISSPGIERKLIRDEHYARYIGHDVLVRLIRPVQGMRDFVGALTAKNGDDITIRLDEDTEMTFRKSEAAFVRLYVDFDSGGLER